MLVRVDLDIVKNPPPVIGSNLDNFLISYFSCCLSDFSLVLSNLSSVLLKRFCTDLNADSTVKVRPTRFSMLLPDYILNDKNKKKSSLLTHCNCVSKEDEILIKISRVLSDKFYNASEGYNNSHPLQYCVEQHQERREDCGELFIVETGIIIFVFF